MTRVTANFLHASAICLVIVGFLVASDRSISADVQCQISVSVDGTSASFTGSIVGPKLEGGGAGYTGVIVLDSTFIVQCNGDGGCDLSGSSSGIAPGSHTAYTRGSGIDSSSCEASQPFDIS
jgi:hypothetical protein